MERGEALQVLAISGSLRKASYNTAALRAAKDLAPPDLMVETFDLAPIPLYDEDVRQRGLPPAVAALREAIRAAHALLIVTPEYNYSMPGLLKNAIDWASRPPDQPFAGKPVAIMGASPGRFGTVRAQQHLRLCLIGLDAHPLNRPQVLIAEANKRFDAEGRLIDEATREHVRKLMQALAAWTRRLA